MESERELTRDEQLIVKYYEPHPYETLDKARLKVEGVEVWALVGHYRALRGSVTRKRAQLAEDYDIPPEAVEATFAFYKRHKKIIDAKLLLNDLSRHYEPLFDQDPAEESLKEDGTVQPSETED
jgi:hypothetical protein